jgi:hypothetical protein
VKERRERGLCFGVEKRRRFRTGIAMERITLHREREREREREIVHYILQEVNGMSY